MYFLAMLNNSAVKPFIIAHNNALSHLGRGILSYLCSLPGGILSEGILSKGFCPGGLYPGDFVRFPPEGDVLWACMHKVDR